MQTEKTSLFCDFKGHRQGIHSFLRLIFLSFLLVFFSNSYAKGNYHVEVVVFKQSGSAPGTKAPVFDDIPSFAKTWNSNTVYLNSHAAKIRASGKYQVISHTAWGQASASYSNSAAKTFAADAVSGFIKVYARQLLLADIQLNFEGHKLSERRRLKLNEVHYFDNEGFGVLMRVSRL